MHKSLSILAFILALAAAPAVAQSSDTEGSDAETTEQTAEPADGDAAQSGEGAGDSLGLALGEPEGPQVGDTYLRETFTDWEQRCIKTEDDNDPCQLYQLLLDEEGNSVAEITMFALPEGQRAEAGANLITPLETLLTQQVRLAIDGGESKRYPFNFCTQVGCVSRLGFTAEEVSAFRRGSVATVTIVPAASPEQTVVLRMSLSGFTAGFAAVRETAGNQ